MTVSELISELKDYDSEQEVRMNGYTITPSSIRQMNSFLDIGWALKNPAREIEGLREQMLELQNALDTLEEIIAELDGMV